MQPVSLHTNFTGRKVLGSFFCEVVCRSNRLCSAGRTKTSDGLGQKTSRQSQEWPPPPSGHCEIAIANRSGSVACATSFGREFRKTFLTQNRTARTRRG